MLASFVDETQKIAANATVSASSSNVISKSAPRSTGPKIKGHVAPEVKSTSYSVVQSQQPEAANPAASSKLAPPPPVRT